MSRTLSTLGAAATALTLALGTAACGGDDGGEEVADRDVVRDIPVTSEHHPEVLSTVASGLDVPWGVAFLPDGSALVSERDSALIKRIDEDGTVSEVGKVPGVVPGGEGGLLGIAVAKNFSRKPLLYAYFTAENDNRIVRMDYAEDGLGRPEVLVEGIEKASIHNGGALLFGPDGMLYASTGDASQQDLASNLDSLNGKVLRMTPDGKPPKGNPFGDSLVYTIGHRNVQGLAFDAEKRLWASEFGPDKDDELNYIRAGKGYGWPSVTGVDGLDRHANPVRTWPTEVNSPSGITVADDAVWMAALRGERLWEIPITRLTGEDENPLTGSPRVWYDGEYGRLRTVVTAPDGTLWLVTGNTDGRGEPREDDDQILQLRVAKGAAGAGDTAPTAGTTDSEATPAKP